MYHLLWNRDEQRRHKRRNLVQSALLLAGMAALLSACGWAVAGVEGVLWALLAGGVGLAFSPRLPPRLILRLFRARPIPAWQLPEVYAALEEICRAAGLARAPVLYYLPSPVMNAFSLGGRDDAAIAVSDALLRRVDLGELAGILAHEVSHIRNGDIWLMTLADTITRLTRMMSQIGLLLLLFSLPALFAADREVPWLLAALLLAAPTLGALMQLALARTREFDADLDAAGLTGDPAALASALAKLAEDERGLLARLLMPGGGGQPSLLRTHPAIPARIERLLSLQVPVRIPTRRVGIVLPAGLAPRHPRRRRRWLG